MDFAFCNVLKASTCSRRYYCKRFTSVPGEHQSYSEFTDCNFPEYEYFMPNDFYEQMIFKDRDG